MATKRKVPAAENTTSKTNAMKWGRNVDKNSPPNKGSRPLPDPASVKQIFVMVFIHVCRKITMVEPEVKIGIYAAALMFGSVICDFFPLPKTYMSNKQNVFNQYFVKLGWGWTLFIVGIFVYLTSSIYCCGDRARIKRHLSRLAVGTVCWYICTNFFLFVEASTGTCLKADRHKTKDECIEKGFKWIGFDISGHAFLLIYSSLILIEESKAFRGWERIGELVRNEEYDDDSPLRVLKQSELLYLKVSYEKLLVYVKVSFVSLTGLIILWDFMLICTIIYFHTMAQKVAGGLFAVVCWFITYRLWYINELSPGLPGQGQFRYADLKPLSFHSERASIQRRRSLSSVRQAAPSATTTPPIQDLSNNITPRSVTFQNPVETRLR